MQHERLKRLRTAMQTADLEAMWVTNSFNRRYLSGFTGSSGFLLVTADQAILLTDFRYMQQAPREVQGFNVMEHQPKMLDSLKQLLATFGVKRLGFEQHDLSYGTYLRYAEQLAHISLIPTNELIENLRMTKDVTELQTMQEAANLADDTFQFILTKLKPGVSEQEIALEIEFYLRKHGATSSSFTTIVASGERSALPHGVASERKLQNNEFVTLDFGAYYQGYCSDLTRTVVLGKPSARHKEIYDIVREAQEHVLARLKPGMTGQQADALARDVISKYGYGDQFGHGTGHGLGMEIHEAPRLSRQSDAVLQPGMVVTVEPGIYISEFGGVRIEDDVVITESGIQIMTHSAKQLLTIE